MQLSQLLSPENTYSSVKCSSKKKALEIISELAAPQLNRDPYDLFELLLAREKMGTTALGGGLAFPHSKLENNDTPALALFLQLEAPIDFESVDNQPVDLLFALFIPEKECKTNQALLPTVAEFLGDKGVARQLRNAKNSQELYAILTEKDLSI